MSREIKIQIPAKALPLITERRRYKSLRGGRGSGKSHTVARALLIRAMAQPGFRAACCREVQESIATSVKRLIDDLIIEYGLAGIFQSQKTKIITPGNGEFTFHGLQDHTADSVKSLEGSHVAWLEEAQKISTHSWTVLTPTIRTTGSEIWASWNPDSETDEVYRRTVLAPWVPEHEMLDIVMNWRDNPFYNEVLESERLTLKRMNEDLYNHVWEGHLRTLAGLLFKRVWFRRYPLGQHPAGMTMYMGTDYATTAVDDPEVKQEPDWTELGVWGHDEHQHLWAVDWYSGQVEPDGPNGWIGEMAKLAKRWDVERIFEESGPIYRATKAPLSRSLRNRGCMAVRTALPSVNKKAERAMGFVALASDLVIHIPDCEWGDRLVNQLCAFTGEEGKVDDMVDSCSVLARGLASMAVPDETPEEKRRSIEPFTEAHTMGRHDEDDDDPMQEYGET